MTPIKIQDFAQRVGGEPIGFADGAEITGFATDSGSVQPGNLFLAIRGLRVDGHEFAPQALAAGAVGVLAERPIEGPHILVSNLVRALAAFGQSQRRAFEGPVIGITGSAGKTTTKEFLAAALTPMGEVLVTPGNRNTEYTVPLVWADLTDQTQVAVIEMAMRGFGQIAHLASFCRPTIGVITNIGFSHLEQVGSRGGIAKAKGELLEALPRENGVAVLWQGDGFLTTLKERVRSGRVRTFGFTDFADCRISRYEATNWHRAVVAGSLDGEPWEIELPAVGRHLALNASAALLAALLAGVKVSDASQAMSQAKLPPMRMEILDFKGATIVLDAYNASPPSMLSAIETLRDVPTTGRRLAVIGEMRELGAHTDEAHQTVGRALAQYQIDEIMFVGDATEMAWNECLAAGMAPDRFRIAKSLSDVTEFVKSARPGDVVLVKGSRALELERSLEPLAVTPT